MIYKLLLIGAGGFLGAIARYSIGGYVNGLLEKSGFHYGTMFVNIVGCLLIGLLSGLAESKDVLTPEIRMLVIVGFLGAFTTFSAFGLETFRLIDNAMVLKALLNIGGQVVFGLIAVWIGFVLSRVF
ncbi:MAG: fluoride efflux transporter CrcB [Chlorobi bacterium]|nr:fluoride efflux transporter CrcB [Chlorobiota bacterium]